MEQLILDYNAEEDMSLLINYYSIDWALIVLLPHLTSFRFFHDLNFISISSLSLRSKQIFQFQV